MDRLDCDRMFIAVVSEGSFIGAARRLGVSPGQASKLVSRLEADLGVQLVKRTTRALALTEVGHAYHERIKGLIDEFDALDASVRNASGAPSGRLRFTAPTSFGMLSLMPLLLEFTNAFPEIQLDASFSDRMTNLVDEGFDLAVRIGKPSDSSLIARKLCDARIVIVASPAYLARHDAPVTPADLAGHDCIIDTNFPDPSRWRFMLPQDKEALLVPVAGRLRFSNAQACLAAAAAGHGIAYVPSFVAGPCIRDGKVTQLLAGWEDTPRAVHALYPPARHLASKVRVLVDFLANSFRGQPEWDRGW